MSMWGHVGITQGDHGEVGLHSPRRSSRLLLPRTVLQPAGYGLNYEKDQQASSSKAAAVRRSP